LFFRFGRRHTAISPLCHAFDVLFFARGQLSNCRGALREGRWRNIYVLQPRTENRFALFPELL
jgi:hypothetical protein